MAPQYESVKVVKIWEQEWPNGQQMAQFESPRHCIPSVSSPFLRLREFSFSPSNCPSGVDKMFFIMKVRRRENNCQHIKLNLSKVWKWTKGEITITEWGIIVNSDSLTPLRLAVVVTDRNEKNEIRHAGFSRQHHSIMHRARQKGELQVA